MQRRIKATKKKVDSKKEIMKRKEILANKIARIKQGLSARDEL